MHRARFKGGAAAKEKAAGSPPHELARREHLERGLLKDASRVLSTEERRIYEPQIPVDWLALKARVQQPVQLGDGKEWILLDRATQVETRICHRSGVDYPACP